jgi:hypothetical protein
VLVACAWWSLHTMTASHHSEMGGVNLSNCRQFNCFSKMLLRFWYFCLIGPYFIHSRKRLRCELSSSCLSMLLKTIQTARRKLTEQSNSVVNGIDVGPPLSRAGAVQLPHAVDGLRVIGLQASSHSRVLQRV